MNPLLEYLNTNFKNDTTNIVDHFLTTFGVNVKQEGNLFLFKYDMILAKFSYELVHECRGHIWRHSNFIWERVCNTPNKFFNLSEGNCKIFNNDEFNSIVDELCAVRKEDGTLSSIWWDSEKNDWRCSTQGCITPFKIQDYEETFSDLFWFLFGEDKKQILSEIGKEYTFCFEICTNKNRIVTKYSTDRIYLLLIRHVNTGVYIPVDSYAEMLNVKIPDKSFLYEHCIKTKEDLNKWVESSCNDDNDCMYKEGYVLYHNLIPVAKCKTEKYRILHKTSSGDIGATRNNLIELFFAGGCDDIYETLVDSMKLFVDRMRNWYMEQTAKMLNDCKILSSKSYFSQKEYALEVLKLNKTFSSFYFNNKEVIINKTVTLDDINVWMKLHYQRFDDEIKNLK